MLRSILILSCIACENLGNFGGSRSQAQAYPLSSHVNGNATIVATETISRSQSIGLGTLAGAAIGGLLGYQVGGGTGKTVTTIAGAAGDA